MESTKSANTNTQLSPVTRAPQRATNNQNGAARSNGGTASRKRTDPADAKLKQPIRKKTLGKPKAEKLVCRYCGSADLAPSFIKRRDRRCRKCFAKKYGSEARTKKASVKK